MLTDEASTTEDGKLFHMQDISLAEESLSQLKPTSLNLYFEIVTLTLIFLSCKKAAIHLVTIGSTLASISFSISFA